MLPVDPRVLRFLLRFWRERPAFEERELLIEVEGEQRGSSVYLSEAPGRVPVWILLHGVTVPGRHHVALRRMARCLAAAGHAVVVPEVPSWSALRVRPSDAEPTVRAALRFVDGWERADPERVGLMGFSVSATWALEVAAGELGSRLRAAVGVAGYGDFREMVRAMVVGEFEWEGERRRYRLDPYGRRMMGVAMLPLLEGDEYGDQWERERASEALHELVVTAGHAGAMSDSPVYDPLIRALREQVSERSRGAWDLLAGSSEELVPDRAAGLALADELAAAGLRAYPELDPAGRLEDLRARVCLLHGRFDRLVPFSETLRLASYVPPAARCSVTITRLAGHTKTVEAAPLRNPATLTREGWRFASFVACVLGGVVD